MLKITLAIVIGMVVLVSVVVYFIRQPSWRVMAYTPSQRSDPARLQAHVRWLCESVRPRNTRHPEKLDRAADYIAGALAESGGRVEEQTYIAGGVACRNIRAWFGPRSGPHLIVGAHYDVCGDLPGADDNASGVAGLLEIGRLLGAHPPTIRVELVAYSTEEPPFFGSPEMGSAVHARGLREQNAALVGMICLEMIGYYTERQPVPHWVLGLLYPRTGDFITVVGRWQDRHLARHVKAAINGAGSTSAYSFTGPPILGADLSDHRNYWLNGYPAVMITDTAFIRNPNYHTAADVPESLDYARMADVVDGVANAVFGFPAASD